MVTETENWDCVLQNCKWPVCMASRPAFPQWWSRTFLVITSVSVCYPNVAFLSVYRFDGFCWITRKTPQKYKVCSKRAWRPRKWITTLLVLPEKSHATSCHNGYRDQRKPSSIEFHTLSTGSCVTDPSVTEMLRCVVRMVRACVDRRREICSQEFTLKEPLIEWRFMKVRSFLNWNRCCSAWTTSSSRWLLRGTLM